MPKVIISLTDSKIKSAISKHKKSLDRNIKLSDGGVYWRFDYVRPILKINW